VPRKKANESHTELSKKKWKEELHEVSRVGGEGSFVRSLGKWQQAKVLSVQRGRGKQLKKRGIYLSHAVKEMEEWVLLFQKGAAGRVGLS